MENRSFNQTDSSQNNKKGGTNRIFDAIKAVFGGKDRHASGGQVSNSVEGNDRSDNTLLASSSRSEISPSSHEQKQENWEESKEKKGMYRLPPELKSRIFGEVLCDKQIDVRRRIELAKEMGKLDKENGFIEIPSILKNNKIDEKIRNAIVHGTIKVLDKNNVKELLHMIIRDENVNELWRCDIAYPSGKFVDKNNIGDFVNLLRNEQISIFVRERMVIGIGDSGCKDIAGKLLPVIRDENIDFEVRAMAGSSAVLLGENDLADELVPFLHSNHQSWSYDRDRIARAIGGSGRQDLAEKLVSKLYDELRAQGSILTCQSIVKAIVMLGEKDSISNLTKLVFNMHIVPNDNYSYNISEDEHYHKALEIFQPKLKLNKYDNKHTAKNSIRNICKYIAEAFAVPGCKNVAEHLVPLLWNEQIENSLHDKITYSIIKLGDQTIIPLLKENYEIMKKNYENAHNEWKENHGTCEDTGYFQLNSYKHIYENINMAILMLENKSVEKIICNKQIKWDTRAQIIEAIPHIADISALPKLEKIHAEKLVEEDMLFLLSQSIEQLNEEKV